MSACVLYIEWRPVGYILEAQGLKSLVEGRTTTLSQEMWFADIPEGWDGNTHTHTHTGDWGAEHALCTLKVSLIPESVTGQ